MALPPSFWILAATEGLMAAGYAVSFPFLAVYLNTQRGLPMSWIGVFLALSMLVSSAAQFAGGEVSDAVGRRKVMIWSLALRTLNIAAIAFAIYGAWPLWFIFVVHPLGMLAGGFFHPAARAWVADQTPPAGRMKAYGFLRMGMNAGWALGPAAGGLLAAGSYTLMFFATALVFAACTVIVAFSIKDVPGQAGSAAGTSGFSGFSSALADRTFLRFCVFSFTMSAVMSQLVVSSSLYSKAFLGFSEREIGLLFSLNGLLVVAFQYLVTRALEGRRITSGLGAGALLYAAGYLAFGYSPSFFFAAAAMVVITLGELAVSPGMQAMGANMAPPSAKGRYLGVHGVFEQVGKSAGILAGSNAIGFISPHFREGPWFIVAAVAVVSCLGFLSLGRRLTREQDGLRGPTLPPPPGEAEPALGLPTAK